MTFEVIKDPNASYSWTEDWSDWLATGDTISSATWTISGCDLALTEVTSSNTDTTTTIKVSGGTLDKRYYATCRIITANGETNDRTIAFYMYQE